ncbi:MAG TPA: hypothetical protein PK941_14385 [Paludibacter sp.]|jgi:hypothetical protein|nr:hypothetical protein [Paludibacter sp.]
MKYKKVLIITVVITSLFFIAFNILSYETNGGGTFTMNQLDQYVSEWLNINNYNNHPESDGPPALKTHPWLTLRAIQLYEQYNPPLERWQKIEIIRGSIEEDYDIEGTASGDILGLIARDAELTDAIGDKVDQSGRCMNHFMDAKGNGIWPFASALKWATTDPKNLTRYDEAVRLLKDEKNTIGWRYLGHVLHLLQDMSVPAHVRADMHGGGDTYELELRELNIVDYCNIVGNCNISNLGEPKAIDTTEPDEYFIQLAADTRNNFYSDNSFTFMLKSLPPNIVTCDEQYLCNSNVGNGKIYVADKNGWMNSLPKMPSALGGEKKYYKITDKVAASMFSYLGLQAIQYGAGLIKLFYNETKQTCVPTNANCIYNTCSSETCYDGCSFVQGVRACGLTIKGWGEVAP